MAGEKVDKSVLREAEKARVERRSALKSSTKRNGTGTKTVSFADEGYSLHTFFSSPVWDKATTVAAASVSIGTIAGMIASYYNLLD